MLGNVEAELGSVELKLSEIRKANGGQIPPNDSYAATLALMREKLIETASVASLLTKAEMVRGVPQQAEATPGSFDKPEDPELDGPGWREDVPLSEWTTDEKVNYIEKNGRASFEDLLRGAR